MIASAVDPAGLPFVPASPQWYMQALSHWVFGERHMLLECCMPLHAHA